MPSVFFTPMLGSTTAVMALAVSGVTAAPVESFQLSVAVLVTLLPATLAATLATVAPKLTAMVAGAPGAVLKPPVGKLTVTVLAASPAVMPAVAAVAAEPFRVTTRGTADA